MHVLYSLHPLPLLFCQKSNQRFPARSILCKSRLLILLTYPLSLSLCTLNNISSESSKDTFLIHYFRDILLLPYSGKKKRTKSSLGKRYYLFYCATLQALWSIIWDWIWVCDSFTIIRIHTEWGPEVKLSNSHLYSASWWSRAALKQRKCWQSLETKRMRQSDGREKGWVKGIEIILSAM